MPFVPIEGEQPRPVENEDSQKLMRVPRRTVIRVTSGLLALGGVAGLIAYVDPEASEVPKLDPTPNPLPLAQAARLDTTATPVIVSASVFAAKPYVNPDATSCAGAIIINPDRIPTPNGFLEKRVIESPGSASGQSTYYLERLTRDPNQTEIFDLFRPSQFKFSNLIRAAGLVPRVIRPNEPISTYIEAGNDYLKRVAELLAAFPALRGPRMDELGVVRENGYPVDLPPHFRLSDVLNSYFFDLNNTFRFARTPALNSSYSLAMYPTIELDHDLLVVKGRVSTSVDILKDRPRFEDNNQVYYQYTDAQYSAKQFHEYMHYLQRRSQSKRILAQKSCAELIGNNPTELDSWLARCQREDQQKFEDRLMEINPGMLLSQAARYSPHEAQANLIPQLMIHTLAQANDTKRFPGFGDDDPFNVAQPTLFGTFRSYVLPKKEGVGMPLDLNWLNLHKDWPQVR